MSNDKDWQRRSDDWVKSTHKSRLKKEKRAADLTPMDKKSIGSSVESQNKSDKIEKT